MTNREPEPWESSAPGAFLWIERPRGTVQVWAIGHERFCVRAPGQEQEVVGFEAARQAAHARAEQLG
jgi:hypothetical protein